MCIYTFTHRSAPTSKRMPSSSCRPLSLDEVIVPLSHAVVQPIYNITQNVSCWYPISTLPVEKVQKWPFCGNNNCYKIFDPANEKKVDMLGLTIFGLCGCVFLILFGCYWCFYRFIDTKCGTLETGALETDIVLDYGVRR